MDSKVSLIVKLVLLLAVVFLSYMLYSIIQEPIQYEKIKADRYTSIQDRLEHIRDAQKAYRAEFGAFAPNFEQLIAFVDTGKQSIIERKDSSFMRYNKVYQQEMEVDTIITKILGYKPVKETLFDEGFNAANLERIPKTDDLKFDMSASKIKVNDIVVPVFEARAENTKIFADVLSKYDQFIDKEYALIVGSLTEPTLSGNWK
jgi:hypothetical protein